MELWLLGAGAVVLIAITVWIVWPATTRPEEGAAVDDNARRGMPPQGDRFEDQYTSATADLSAGGVASAMQSMQSDENEAGRDTTSAARETASGLAAPRGFTESTTRGFGESTTPSRQIDLREPKTIGIGAGALLAAGSAIGGAWLYSRWQAERNKPINRYRRAARDMAGRVGERLPDTPFRPEYAAPLGGTASALVIGSLMLARALRREDPVVSETRRVRALVQEIMDMPREHRGPVAAELTRSLMKDFVGSSRLRAERLPSRNEVRRILLHELQHAVDASRKQRGRFSVLKSRGGRG